MKLLATLLALAVLAGSASDAIGAERVRVARTPLDGFAADAECGPDGVLHLAFVAGDDAYYARSTDDGRSFSIPNRINTRLGTVAAGLFRGPDVALGKDGAVHVLWYVNAFQRRRPKEEWGVYYSRMAKGADSFEPERNLNHLPSDNYSLAANRRGDVAVVWMAGGLFVNLSHDNGETFAAPEKVANADPCECCGSRALFGEDGTLFCAYRDKTGAGGQRGAQRDMYLLARRPGAADWSRVAASDATWSINACPMTGNFLAPGLKGLLMGWETRGAISFAAFDAAGRRTGGEIVAAPAGKYPVVLRAPDGVICASWKNAGALHWRLYSADGAPLGEEESKPSPNASRHGGAVTARGEFVLVD